MLNQRSFSQILNDLHDTESMSDQSANRDYSAGWESHLDPFGMTELMSKINVAPFYKVDLQKAYPVKRQPRAEFKRPSHLLNEQQTAAFNVLKSYCPHIKDNFNLHELKSTYRHSVLKTHPDQGGSSETFQQVKKSYQILLALVKN